jgi:DNA-binding beta-propeller fold protein YncE
MKSFSQMKRQKLLFICSAISLLLLFQGCKKDNNHNDPDKLDIPELIGTWKIDQDGGKIPWGIAVDSKGNVYTSDLMAGKISKFTSAGTLVTRWGTSGNGNGQLAWPKHIAVDGDDNVYVADEQNHRIQKFTSSGGYITQWGNPAPVDGELAWAPGAVAVDIVKDWVYVVDMQNRLQKMDLSGNFITQWGGTGKGDGQLRLGDMNDLDNQGPNGQMAVDVMDNIFVVDNMNHRVQKFKPSGDFLMKFGSRGSGNGQFLFPVGIAIDNKNGFIYVSDNSTRNGGTDNIARIEKFDLSGNFIKQWILKDQEGNQSICALAVDNEGNVLAIEGGSVVKYDFK